MKVEYKRGARALQSLSRVPGGAELIQKEGLKVPVVEQQVTQQPEPQAPANEPPAVVNSEPVKPEPVKTEPVKEEPQYVPQDVQVPADVEELSEDQIDKLVNVAEPVKENFKRFRAKLKHVSSEAKTYKQQADELRKKITDYETGLATPEVLEKMQSRLSELEKYEKIYSIKSSPAYVKNYVEPVNSEMEKLNKLATDYKIDPAVLTSAAAMENTAEVNRLLTRAFGGDDVGALEAKAIIKNIKSIQDKAKEAEQEPQKVLASIEEESNRIRETERARANEIIANQSRDAWTDTLVEAKKEGLFPELVYKEGDTEHNEKVVRPLLQRAGQEYGKLVKHLAINGLNQLPKDTAVALARMTQMAHQAALLAVERKNLTARVQELESLLQQRGVLSRPSLNGNARVDKSSGQPQQQPKQQGRLENRARDVLQRVIQSSK